VLRPGVLTLVLAPPGHGKSALLKTLAGRMQNREEGKGLSGTLRWNGLTAKEMEEKGLQLSKLCAYCDQVDLYVVGTQKQTTTACVSEMMCARVSSRRHPAALADSVLCILVLLYVALSLCLLCVFVPPVTSRC
jgi:energy-coupling factor transporter ATP-binding protein EcfA2